MDSSGLNPSPGDLTLSHWVSFSLSLSLKMKILEYLVVLVVPWGKILLLIIAVRIPKAGAALPSLGIQREKKDEEAQKRVAASPKTPCQQFLYLTI